ncbi:MAG: TlpA family protein disulfide reductase [Candidatus Didemnitutus sp.]|nr:TlpA family protein disulfide reductase [Candidatus Didemnitutus sp.]
MSSRKLPALLAAGLLILGVLASSARAQLARGDAFPDLAAAQLEGALPVTQGRVVLVDFWASWCAPCKASFPALGQVHRDYDARGVTIVAVSEDDKAKDYAAFLKKYAPPFATVRDAAHKLAGAVKVPAMPTTLVLGRDGRVRAVFTGYHGEETEKSLRAALDAALAEPSANPSR